MNNKYVVTRVGPDGARFLETVEAWDFTVVNGGVLVFSSRNRTAAYTDWIKVVQVK